MALAPPQFTTSSNAISLSLPLVRPFSSQGITVTFLQTQTKTQTHTQTQTNTDQDADTDTDLGLDPDPDPDPHPEPNQIQTDPEPDLRPRHKLFLYRRKNRPTTTDPQPQLQPQENEIESQNMNENENQMTQTQTYTFYSVRWATQKGDILGVRAQKVAQLGWGDRFVFSVRAWPSSCGPAQNTEGGTALYFFQIVEASKNLFHLCIAIVDIANLTSLCLQVHTVIFYICPKYHPCVRAIICFFCLIF